MIDKFFGKKDHSIINEGLILAKKDGKYGYINLKNEVVIGFNFNETTIFHNGAAAVEQKGAAFLIDKKGEMIGKNSYMQLLYSNYKDIFIFTDSDSKQGLINAKGEEVLPGTYKYITEFSEERASVFNDNNKIGFIDVTGKVAVPIIYEYVGNFSMGRAIFMDSSNKFGFLNNKGEVAIEAKYDGVTEFYEGKAFIVSLEGKLHLIDINGNSLISGEYIDRLHANYFLYQEKADDPYVVIDSKGIKLDETTYTNVSFTAYNLVVNDSIRDGKQYTILKENGYPAATRLVSASKSRDYYDLKIADFRYYLHEKKDDQSKAHAIDGNMYTYIADDIISFYGDGITVVKRGLKVGLMGKDGKILIDFLYDNIYRTPDNYYIVYSSSKCGLLNSKYQSVIPIECDSFYW